MKRSGWLLWSSLSGMFVILVLAGCGGGSNDTGPTDTTPPVQIGNLRATVESESTAVLTWTAPGDDGMAGTAERYDLRWSRQTLTEGTWSTGTVCPSVPAPGHPGSPETYRAKGLPPATPVVLALRTVDDADNWSPVSNVVRLSLPTASPACSLSTPGLDFGSVAPHESATRSFTIKTVGGGTLTGDVQSTGGAFTVIDGGGPFTLRFRESRSITVQFSPETSGPLSGSITLGTSGCAVIPCSGRGSGGFCIMDWDTLQFGPVYVGDHGTWRLTLTNQ